MIRDPGQDGKELPLKGRFGPMPYTRRIYQLSSDETKATLKLVNKVFWTIHVEEKFFNNFSPAQTGFIPQLYCCSKMCQNTKEFVRCFVPSIEVHTNGEIWSDHEDTGHIWPKMDKNGDWSNDTKSKKIRQWHGCADCWSKFTTDRPEYNSDILNYDSL